MVVSAAYSLALGACTVTSAPGSVPHYGGPSSLQSYRGGRVCFACAAAAGAPPPPPPSPHLHMHGASLSLPHGPLSAGSDVTPPPSPPSASSSSSLAVQLDTTCTRRTHRGHDAHARWNVSVCVCDDFVIKAKIILYQIIFIYIPFTVT